MADQFVGEIRMFAGNFQPTGWAFCNGQLLPISQNTALFSLIGTYYGGDGRATFALPNLQARFPLHAGVGAGPGLTQRTVGESGGESAVTVLASQIPAHSHTLRAGPTSTSPAPGPALFLSNPSNGAPVYRPMSHPVQMFPSSISLSGGNQPHNNLQPYLAVTFIIALQGIFPARA